MVWASFKTTFSGFPITTKRREEEKNKGFPKRIECHWRNIGNTGRRAASWKSAFMHGISYRHLFLFFFLLIFLFLSLSLFGLSLPLLHTSRKVFNSINYCTMSAKRISFSSLFYFVLFLYLSSYISSDSSVSLFVFHNWNVFWISISASTIQMFALPMFRWTFLAQQTSLINKYPMKGRTKWRKGTDSTA